MSVYVPKSQRMKDQQYYLLPPLHWEQDRLLPLELEQCRVRLSAP